eukprot:3624631-Rhodomonas_salina.3
MRLIRYRIQCVQEGIQYKACSTPWCYEHVAMSYAWPMRMSLALVRDVYRAVHMVLGKAVYAAMHVWLGC